MGHPAQVSSATRTRAPAVVLVVEDDPGLRMALEHGLAGYDFTVHAAPSAEDAYALAGDLQPDVILLDWILPGGDGGATACRRLHDTCPDSRIVMLTGLEDVRDQRAAFEAGACRFLRKGMALEAIASELRAALGRGRFNRG
jgi:two-component system response regulator MprA